MSPDISQEWAPDACSLPASGRQARTAEFGELFGETVLHVERPEPTRLRLHLRPDPKSAARAATLAAAETECCSFFTFTLTLTGGALTLDVTVPEAHAAMLDALTPGHLAGRPRP